MTHTLVLAATHGSSIPSPVTIVLAIAAVVWVLWSRTKGQPLKAKRLLVLPVVLTVIGVTDLSGSSAPHLTPTDIAFLAASVVVSAVLGAARGATIELYPNQGELWQRYCRSTVGLWVALIVTKVFLLAAASAAGASAGGGTNSLLVSLGASLLAEAAVVGPRALSTGLPFATDHEDFDAKRSGRPRPGPSQSRPSLSNRLLGPAPPHQRGTNARVDDEPYEPAPQGDEGEHNGRGQWKSPSLSDGLDWLRHRADQSATTNWSQHAPSRGPS
ncbi:MAG TPA: hypothetical protein VME20_12015 [Acidimicrobiales bacterium]|nr:hypothetical protein [Acidimicrobiales bacterium]